MRLNFDEPLPAGRLAWPDIERSSLWVIESRDGEWFMVRLVHEVTNAPKTYFGTPLPIPAKDVEDAVKLGLGCPYELGDWSYTSPEQVVSWGPRAKIPEGKFRSGCVYVLSHPHMPGLVKIGWSADTDERAERLSRQANMLADFRVEWDEEVWDPRWVESWLHHHFHHARVPSGKEFFRLAPSESVEGLRRIASLWAVFNHEQRALVAQPKANIRLVS